MAFSNFGLSPAILDGVKAMGYVEPTPIQLRAIPLIMAGQDVIGSAQTGTGKTAAFALPILSKLGQHDPRTRVSDLGTDPRIGRASRNGHSRFCAFHQFESRRRFRRRWLRQANGRAQDAAWISSSRRPADLLDHLERGTCRSGPSRISGARRSRPHARHGFSARRPPHRRKMPAPTPHIAFFRHHSAADRNAHQMGDEQSRRPLKSARGVRRRKRSST